MSYYCSICNEDITKKEYQYSKDRFDKALCRKHQTNAKYVENTSSTSKATNEANRLYVALTEMDWKVLSEPYDGHKHVDLSIPEAKFDIEVDGQHHNYNSKQALSDVKRTFYSYLDGYLTLRIPNSLVNNQEHLEETANHLNKMLQERVKRLDVDEQKRKFAIVGKFVTYAVLVYLILNFFEMI